MAAGLVTRGEQESSEEKAKAKPAKADHKMKKKNQATGHQSTLMTRLKSTLSPHLLR